MPKYFGDEVPEQVARVARVLCRAEVDKVRDPEEIGSYWGGDTRGPRWWLYGGSAQAIIEVIPRRTGSKEEIVTHFVQSLKADGSVEIKLTAGGRTADFTIQRPALRPDGTFDLDKLIDRIRDALES